VVAREVEVDDVGPVTARERPDVALVGLGESSQHALTLIERIVQEFACPVIVLIHAPDPDFVKEASKRGTFAYITDAEPGTGRVRSTSFCAASPSTTTSRAPRPPGDHRSGQGHPHGTSPGERGRCLEMLRDHSRAANRKLVDIASAVVDGRALLPKGGPALPLTMAIVGRAPRTPGSLWPFARSTIWGQEGSEARMRRKDQLRATKLKQVARRLKDGPSKARRLTPVKRAAEAGRAHRRGRR
jgi:hypothetical protein